MDGISAEMDGLMETEGVKRGKKGVFEAFCGVCRKKYLFPCIQVKIMVYYINNGYIRTDIARLRWLQRLFYAFDPRLGQAARFGRLGRLHIGG